MSNLEMTNLAVIVGADDVWAFRLKNSHEGCCQLQHHPVNFLCFIFKIKNN